MCAYTDLRYKKREKGRAPEDEKKPPNFFFYDFAVFFLNFLKATNESEKPAD